ncbi:MAG: aminotransferase class IV [Parahaliea sp.]
MKGTHEYAGDPRNDSILIEINGEHVPRQEAKISVFDSGFILGDGVWEGLRVEGGTVLFLERHLERLFEGMKTLDFLPDFSRDDLARRLYRLLRANGMAEGVHIQWDGLLLTLSFRRRRARMASGNQPFRG